MNRIRSMSFKLMSVMLAAALLLSGCGATSGRTSADASSAEAPVINVVTQDKDQPAAMSGKDVLPEAGEADAEKISGIPETSQQTEAAAAESSSETASEATSAAPTTEEATTAAATTEAATEAASKEQPAAQPASGGGRVVCIDAGHQSHQNSGKEPIGPGATQTKLKVAGGTSGTTTGVPEYKLTLAVALKLQSILTQRGYTVVMCRTSNDVNISNAERAQIANNAGAGAFIRIHANGSTSAGASGALSMAPSASNPYCASIASSSQTLARDVINGFCAKTGAKNDGVSITDTMSGINWCTVPVTIIEMGFMTNPAEDVQMEDENYQTLMAEGMADGIDTFFAGK